MDDFLFDESTELIGKSDDIDFGEFDEGSDNLDDNEMDFDDFNTDSDSNNMGFDNFDEINEGSSFSEDLDSLGNNDTDFDNFDESDESFDNNDIGFDENNESFNDNNNSDFDDDKFEKSDNNAEIEETEILDNSDYIEGDIVEEVEEIHGQKNDFIDSTGNISVQEANDERENGFELVYIDIDKIAVTRRIRKMNSVESLVQSIKSTGLLEPLVVVATETEGLYVLLSGYRRIQACARAGKTRIPCIVNNRVKTTEIPIIEAMYNHSKRYSIKEQIEYIDYLEKDQGILNPTMIEYLLQMDSGDYTKLKDILNDNDDDIVSKLYEGVYDIATAFKKLEQRRKKESAEEKENKRAAKVYDDGAESGADKIEGSGEEVDGYALTEEQIQSLSFNVEELDDSIENKSLSDMLEEDKKLDGFEPHQQEVGKREIIDPIIKKSVMARDNNTCQCCKRGGEQYVDILDFHHIKPVVLSGEDTVDNGIMLCVACHRLVHLYSTDDLHIDKVIIEDLEYDNLPDDKKTQYTNEEIFEDEKRRFKRIVELGSVIRKGIAMMGMNKEQYKKENPNTGIGRRKPGVKAEQEKF